MIVVKEVSPSVQGGYASILKVNEKVPHLCKKTQKQVLEQMKAALRWAEPASHFPGFRTDVWDFF